MQRAIIDWPESPIFHGKKMYVLGIRHQTNSLNQTFIWYELVFEENEYLIYDPSPSRTYGDISLPSHNVKLIESELRMLCIMQNAWGSHNLKNIMFFRINPRNKSGKRMLNICGDNNVYFANVCPTVTEVSNGKGKTDLAHVKQIVFAQEYDLYIICGEQAKKAIGAAFEGSAGLNNKSVIFMPHPASRSLTNNLCKAVKTFIEEKGYQKFRIVDFEQRRGSYKCEYFTNI